MKRQSSIEWLQECMLIHLTHEQQMQFEGLFQQAEEMRKQEIIEAWCNGYDEEDRATSSPLTYYKNTYEKEN